MSFHSSLIADAVLPAYLRSTLSLSDSASVYAGRRPRRVSQGTEVWIERETSAPRAKGGGHQVEEYRYIIHVRHRDGPDGNLSGKRQQDTVEAHQQTLVAALQGTNPLIANLSDLVSVRAEEGTVDNDPDDPIVLDGTVRVSFLER